MTLQLDDPEQSTSPAEAVPLPAGNVSGRLSPSCLAGSGCPTSASGWVPTPRCSVGVAHRGGAVAFVATRSVVTSAIFSRAISSSTRTTASAVSPAFVSSPPAIRQSSSWRSNTAPAIVCTCPWINSTWYRSTKRVKRPGRRSTSSAVPAGARSRGACASRCASWQVICSSSTPGVGGGGIFLRGRYCLAR